MIPHFKRFDKEDILSFTHLRKYETKLGEIVKCDNKGELEKIISETTARYIIFGIPEDVGVKANLGTGGPDTAWSSFLQSFLNIQSNDFLSGENIFVAGYFDFDDARKLINVNAATQEEKVTAYRALVKNIDSAVEEMVKLITVNNKIPVIIGGGQNNAYPAIKGAAKGLYKAELIQLAQINCINLSASTGFQPIEGRHSGNPFRYADEDGYLNKYCLIGVHENDMSQNVLVDMTNNLFMDYITYEDIFIHEKKNFIQAVAHATGVTEDNYTGVEFNPSSIEGVLSNDAPACGITTLQARQYMNFAATDSKIAFLHLCGGASRLENGEISSSTGKLISYLVSDFLKAHDRMG
ncbi:MAG TPA: arginase family protein [Hanamia sp.]